MDERKRDSMVAYIRRRMAEFGISVEEVAAALAEQNAKYSSATGETWNGQGEMPPWLRQAVSAGQSPDHFAISAQPAAPATSRVDWRQDPFAGSQLATIKA